MAKSSGQLLRFVEGLITELLRLIGVNPTANGV
jgi:hypothetical protein